MAQVSSFEKVQYQFPEKIRVLVVDNNPTDLDFIKQICNLCNYEVSTCTESTQALNLVLERKDCIDLILIEVHMPTMNGYEFLYRASKEIDVPVIVMSLDHSNYTVTRAVQLGACDFWVKPLRYYQFKNMWTHVLRKSLKENNIQTKDYVGSLEDGERSRKRGKDNSEFGSSSVVRDQSNSSSKEAEESKHRVSSMKKPRVVWIAELHSKFVNAVKKLGLHQAVPKRIVEEMNVPGLTRENVASHLQKYRDYLKRKSEMKETQTQEHTEMQLPNMVPGTTESRSIRTLADPSVYGAQPPSNANVSVGAMQQSLIHQQMMISGNPASSVSRNIDYAQSSNPNPLGFLQIHDGNTLNQYTATEASISQQLQNSSLTSGAASSVSPYAYGSTSPILSLSLGLPNTSATGLSNQNSSTDVVDNTKNEDH
ncbi:hypothetical protein AAZX31_05G224900 [Glycine max]|nr:two-component response regulator ARR14 [Glycine max]RZC14045.1 Two-component response regulator ORR21 [Glycine soja]KAG4391719.1 hypothetical protein GLYMA_05G239800v4 [Glycine max]KAG5041758.1 hypothetical protein JHK85_014234 [Glycine max]KAG5058873.1 hypothetical protein JHK86_013869 [Glycine max]KAG5155888.1 hypothetical protein JHK82_013857 [Glycine max]